LFDPPEAGEQAKMHAAAVHDGTTVSPASTKGGLPLDYCSGRTFFNCSQKECRMTTNLAERTCTPCRGGIPPLTREQAEDYRRQAPDWDLVDNGTRITRTFKRANFADALSFVERVGRLAEEEQHHPDISFGWGYATISLRTKKIKGLHENDFIMAAKVDRLARG
jgi:4a-hydroxytetrahydrobiopterin dehydratase